MEVAFSLLGPVSMTRDGDPVDLGTRKRHALLAVLLLDANRIVSRERLVDALWGEEPPATAANTLQVHVSQLRRALPEGMLETAAPGYRLRVEPESIDLVRFERLVAESEAADPATAAAVLRRALELWTGEPLADVSTEPFAQNEVARLGELRLGAIEARIDADLALGRHAVVVSELEALIAQHPLRERLHGQLMVALYRAGRQADALAAYQRARETLVDELGLEPSSALRELERAILAHDPALDLPRPQPVRQRRLPASVDALVGRDRDLEALAATLSQHDTRLVTLTGPGGIGKTRLAMESVRRVQDDFADGAAVVALTAIDSAAAVPRAILDALETPEGGSDPVSELVRALGELDLLLLIDNFEHVLEAAPLVSRLLEQAPQLKLVVTSRAALHVRGEREYPVPPLAEDDAAELFVVRAQAANPRLSLSDENADAVAELCARLDGLPLAIELAAARAKLLPPAALLDRLGNRLDLLDSGRRDAPRHQQTLRATLDWSYDLLGADSQGLLAQLGVFAGGCSLEAAEAVCTLDGTMLETLGTLVDESLVHQREDAEPRFTMLELVREYALERLGERGDGETVRERHLAYFVALAERAEPELAGGEQARWFARLELEHANVRAAVAYAIARGDAESALRLAVGVRRFWQIRGYLDEGRQTLEHALALPGQTPSVLRATALNMAGILAAEQGDFTVADERFTRAIDEARTVAAARPLSSALVNLGNLAFFNGDTERARGLYEESIEHFVASGDGRGRATATENLGLLALAAGDFAEAKRWLSLARDLAHEVGDELEVGRAIRALAAVTIELGELAEARALLDESLAIARELGDTHGIALCLETFGGLAATSAEFEHAAMLFGASDAMRASIGARRNPDHEHVYERWVARTLAGVDTATYTRRYEDGRTLGAEDATALTVAAPVRSTH